MSTHATKPNMTGLDNVTLAGKEGWLAYVNATKRAQPEQLSTRALNRLSDSAADDYRVLRNTWHNNLGPFFTPQAKKIHDQLTIVMDADATKDGWQAKDAVAIDGLPGLGKSTTVNAFAKTFHEQEVRRNGPFTAAGDERHPVIRVGMRGNTGMTAFNKAICDFCGHPTRRTGNVDELGRRALDLVRLCETRLLLVDDIHFLHWQRDGGIELNNHFKFIANEFPLTVIMIGIGISERGLLRAGTAQEALAQLARNTTEYSFEGFKNTPGREQRAWRELLASFDHRIVLTRHREGILIEHADYLYRRTDGHIGSLSALLRRACAAAIYTKTEALSKKLFDNITIDSAAERARKELNTAYSTRPHATRIMQRYAS